MAKKVVSSFENGMSTEFSPLKQPQGTYPYAENIVRDAQATVQSERGTKLLADLSDLTNARIVGSTVVEDYVFYFIDSIEGSSIVRLNPNDSYELIIHSGTGYVASNTSEIYNVTPVDSSNPEDLDVLDAGWYFDFSFELTGESQVTVSVINRRPTTYVPPYLEDRPFVTVTSSKLMPEALRPTSYTLNRLSDRYLNNGPGAPISLEVTPAGEVSLKLNYTTDLGDRSILWDTFTYTGVGQLFSVIPTDRLAFSVKYPIQAVGRKDAQGNIILYFTDGINPPRRIDTSIFIDENNFDERTGLFLTPSLPRISNVAVQEGGGLTTGLYSFAARLGTSTGNTTAFSLLSNGIPVINESKASGEHQYDGAAPQTPAGKSIIVSVDNIDTTYDFIEIAVLTYEGIENLTKGYLVAKLPITTSAVQFTYYSDTQIIEELLVETLAAETIEYETAKHILQKDNHLFLSNLTTTSNESLDTKLQAVADNITVHWGYQEYTQPTASSRYPVKLVEDDAESLWQPQYGNSTLAGLYADITAESTFNNYNNPEWTYNKKTYQRDEVYSFALVPIFNGQRYGAGYHIPGNSVAAYLSYKGHNASENAPDNQLRGWKNDDGTIHHRMPSYQTAPPFFLSGNTSSTTVRYRPLELTFKNIDFSDEELQRELEGFIIVRQRRNRPGNGIIVAQGIAKEFFNAIGGGLSPIPHNGHTRMSYVYEDNVNASGPIQSFGRADLNPGSTDYDVANNYFAFYSPDIIHNVIDESYTGVIQEIAQQKVNMLIRAGDTRHVNSTGATIFGAFYHVAYPVSGVGANFNIKQTIDNAATTLVQPFNAGARTSYTLNDSKQLKLTGTTGFLAMKVKNANLNKERNVAPVFDLGMPSVILTPQNVKNNPNVSVNSFLVDSEVEPQDIYNTFTYVPDVYGSLDSAEYIPVKAFYFNDNPGTEVTVMNGDTFLTRYFYHIGDVGDGVTRDYKATIEAYLETKGNYAYRHYTPTQELGSTTIQGTMPYFPKFNVFKEQDTTESLGLWDQDVAAGPGVEYNKHYNFENTTNTFYSKDVFLEEVNNFPNRTIYSLQAFENEQFDSYRVFLTNNYHDIPKETGEITNIFEFNNQLYQHTPHALWRSFVNEKTFINTSTDQVVLGNGGLFPVPSEQVYTQEGGYAGNVSKLTSINTPYGRIFVDDHQQKIFLLGENLLELSHPLLTTYFQNKIDYKDPWRYRAGYDPLNKRALITFEGTAAGVQGDSISYSFENKSWTSVHTYGGTSYVTRDNRLLATAYGNVYEIGTGNSNEIFGELMPSKLHLAINEDPLVTKDLINIKWIQTEKDQIFDNIRIKTESYDTGDVFPDLVRSFSDEQNFLPLGQQHVHLIGGEYRMSIPPDNNPDVTYEDTLYRPTIKGKYGIIELQYTPDLALYTPLNLEYFITEYLNVAE